MPEVSMPLFDQPDPTFYRGTTARTKRTSESGALAAQVDRRRKIDRVRAVWTQPRTLNEIAQITGFGLSSICSIKKCLDGELVEVDEVEKFWGDGRVTKRTRWQLVPAAK